MDLVAAIRSCIADNKLQFLSSIFYKLPFESSLLRFCGPGEAFIHIKQPVKTKRESNQPPAHSLPNLKQAQGKTDDTALLEVMLPPGNSAPVL